MDSAEQRPQAIEAATPPEASALEAEQTAPPAVVVGDRLVLTPTAWGRLGEAMADFHGRSVFVFGGIPGEEVLAEVVRVHRRYFAARVVEVLAASPERVTPPCPYFGNCTGCQWQHLAYEAQLETKREKVVDALARVGGFSDVEVAPVLPSADQYGYRNHARFTVNREGQLGFVNRETRRFVRIDTCGLMHQGINDLLDRLQDRCQETSQLSIRASKYSGDFLIQPSLAHPGIDVPTGQKRYSESVDGRDFMVSSPSFFQVNVEQAAQAAVVLREHLSLTVDDVLLDAYTGVGTFAVLLAPLVKKVIAVEESSAAVADARENATGLDNLEFVLGRTEDVLRGLTERPDAVVLDPPRAGCQAGALTSLIEMEAPRVAYVSCDAETLARDLKVLSEGGYILERVVPIDMFPQTHHVECVAALRWGGANAAGTNAAAPIVLASASPRRRQLLEELGLPFDVRPADVDEQPLEGETPENMVQRLSLEKALRVADSIPSGFVIGADSTVVHRGESIGKPVDDNDAKAMLHRLRGTTHEVYTGVTVVDAASGRRTTDWMASTITLRDLSDEEIERSVASGAPRDKAGAYAVQDTELRPASAWEGCYSNIVGLPVCRLLEMLAELGFPWPEDWSIPQQAVCSHRCRLAPTEDAAP